MSDDVRADARRLLQGITPGPWEVNSDGWATISSGPDSVIHAYSEHAVCDCGAEVEGSPGVAISIEDAEFIAAAPALVAGLLAELDQEHDRALRLAIRATGCEKAETESDAANATLARIQAVCADVDQDGGHSGPTLARHILNIISGEA